MTTPTLNSKDIINSNATDVSTSLLGAPYKYWDYIKSPSEMGMSSDGNLSAFSRDFAGLIEYAKLLSEGQSNASKTGGPLGNQYFLQTGAKCKDIHSCDNKPEGCQLTEVDRFIYINNIPMGNIPFLSSAIGNFSEAKGLIPGALGNLNALNPFALFQAFTAGATPDCQSVVLNTVSTTNRKGIDAHFIALVDIENMDPCVFPNKTNPVSGKLCKETFTNLHSQPQDISIPQDNLVQLYFLSLSIIGLYILFKLMKS